MDTFLETKKMMSFDFVWKMQMRRIQISIKWTYKMPVYFQDDCISNIGWDKNLQDSDLVKKFKENNQHLVTSDRLVGSSEE